MRFVRAAAAVVCTRVAVFFSVYTALLLEHTRHL